MNTEYPSESQRQFEQMILAGECAIGEMVTADRLAARLEASPLEMRRILLAAYRKGLVDRVGEGPDSSQNDAFRVLGVPPSKHASVFTHTAGAGLKPRSVVRQVVVEPASPEVASKLEVAVDSSVYRYVRTRYVAEQALANQTNYMPFAICPGLEHDNVSRVSFQQLLEKRYLAVLAEMEEWFRLVPATVEDREILDLPGDSKVLLIERVARGVTGLPLVWANLRIRLDRYEYVSALWPQAAHLLGSKSP